MRRRQLLALMITIWVLILAVISIQEARANEAQGCYTQELHELRYQLVGEGDTGEWYETLSPGEITHRDAGVLYAWVGHYMWIIYAAEPYDETGEPQHVGSAAPTGPGLWRLCANWVPQGGTLGAVTLERLSAPAPVRPAAAAVEEGVLVWMPM